MGWTEVGGSGTAGIRVVSEEQVGGTDMTEVQIGVEIGGTEVEGNGTAETGVVFGDKWDAQKGQRFKIVKEWVGLM